MVTAPPKSPKSKSKKATKGGIIEIKRKGGVRYRAWFPDGAGGKGWCEMASDRETAEELLRSALNKARSMPLRSITLRQGVDRVLARFRSAKREGSVRWFAGKPREEEVNGNKVEVLGGVAKVLLEYFGETTALDAVKSTKVEQFIEDKLKAVSASSVLHYRRALTLIYNDCKRFVRKNPLHDLNKNAWPELREPDTDFFEEREIQAIVKRIRSSGEPVAEEDADLVSLLYLTGLRRAEAALLKVEDIDLKKRTMRIDGKTDNVRVKIDQETADILSRMIGRTSGTGPLVPFGAERISNVFFKWSKALGEPRLHAHTMRHTFCTVLARRGRHLLEIQKLARHSSPDVTKRYFHLTDDATPGLSLTQKPAGRKQKTRTAKQTALRLLKGVSA